MKKLGIDRSTDLSYSNNRSRELRPDQSLLNHGFIFIGKFKPGDTIKITEKQQRQGYEVWREQNIERNLKGEIFGSGI